MGAEQRVFYVNTDTDADIITWLDKLPEKERSETIRKIIRKHIKGEVATLEAERAKLLKNLTNLDARIDAAKVVMEVPESPIERFTSPERVLLYLQTSEEPPSATLEWLFWGAYRRARKGKVNIQSWAESWRGLVKKAGYKDTMAFATGIIDAYNRLFDDEELKGEIPSGYQRAP